MLGRERAYAGRHRHSLRHMYAKNSPQISFWAKRAEPAHRVGRSRPQRSRPPPPPKAGPARCAANGWRQDRLVGPTCEEERKRRRPGADNKGERREEEAGKEEEAAEKPAGPDRGWGRGAAGQASARLKVERANDVQRFESLAEATNRLAAKETKEMLYKTTLRVAG